MKLEDQVLTIEQAKHLQELGLDMSDAALCYFGIRNKNIHEIRLFDSFMQALFSKGLQNCEAIPTYTLQEVLDKLPKNIAYDSKIYRLKYGFMHNIIYYREAGDNRSNAFAHCGDIMSNVYKALCWVLENGYLKEEIK